LIILAIASILGTLIPQQDGAVEFAQKLSPGLFRLFSLLDLFDMYHSTWFRIIIGSLALNLLVCSIDRFPATMKLFRATTRADRSKPFDNLPPRRSFLVQGAIENIANLMPEILRKRYKNVEMKNTDKGNFFYSRKGRYSYFGFYLVHLSVLFILIGGIIGSFLGFEAYVNIVEGDTVDTVNLRKNKQPIQLGFSIRCEKFTVDFYDNGTPKQFRSDLSFLSGGKVLENGSLLVNHPITFKGITFYQSSYGTIPGDKIHLKISKKMSDPENSILAVKMGKPVSLPENGGQFLVRDMRQDLMRMGPAVLILIKSPEGEETQFWVFQHHKKIKARFPDIFTKFPKIYKPYTFFLEKIESRFYTGLQVNRDPGVPFIWFGCFAMVTGFFITFFTSQRQIWVRVSKDEGDIRVSVAGRANKNPVGLERELDQLTHKLKNLLMGEGQE
jgi:cytochrome c biogenesis protein